MHTKYVYGIKDLESATFSTVAVILDLRLTAREDHLTLMRIIGHDGTYTQEPLGTFVVY